LDDYYDRVFLDSVKELLREKHDIELCHITVDWQAENWDDYRKFLGTSLVYVNLTKESPMPRSRTEAMLSGCCVITTPFQDADKFIVDGVNGFIIKRDPEQVVERIKWCLDNQAEAIKIGQNGKKTAQTLFSRERYKKDWKALLEKVLNRKIEENEQN
jgi:glycosyltransferase involved in cell wall biosynthesis